MFYLTFSKRKTLILLVIINVILLAATVVAAAVTSGKRLDSFSLRKEYLIDLGYTIDEGFTEEIRHLTLPTKFSETYINYNELQKRNGFDLAKYKGFTITQYTIKVFDKNKRDDLFAHILLFEGRLIGGDVAATAIDGYMKGLKNAP